MIWPQRDLARFLARTPARSDPGPFTPGELSRRSVEASMRSRGWIPDPPPAPSMAQEDLVLERLALETARTDPLTAARTLYAPHEPQESR